MVAVLVIQRSAYEAEIITDHMAAGDRNSTDEYGAIISLSPLSAADMPNTAPTTAATEYVQSESITIQLGTSTSEGHGSLEVATQVDPSTDLESASRQQEAVLGSSPGRDAAKSVLMAIVGPVKAVNARTRKRKAEKATLLTSSPYKKLLESKVKASGGKVAAKLKAATSVRKIPSRLEPAKNLKQPRFIYLFI